MLILGEKINTVNKNVAQALKDKDKMFFQNLVAAQLESGIVDVVDVNVGLDGVTELTDMEWMIPVVEEVTEGKVPLSIDSSSPEAIIAGVEKLKNRDGAFINSITLEEGRHKDLLPVAKNWNLNIIGLPMDGSGVPESADVRLANAEKLTELASASGIGLDKLYIDCLVEPVSLSCDKARVALETVMQIKEHIPEVQTFICLTAVSFGLPNRRLINRNFLSLLLREGLDSIILDPLDAGLKETLLTSRLLLGEDEYCQDYLDQFRTK